ncbi:D-2-hydroxyacid dehydrogenase [Neptuniibacter caesariensis]|uniref:Glycerate dehydrogenase n=1 Tax=Neptuniibacter caesariensis TaxID=207954 RepID=A0A7U8C4R3_NEPCE|nr:D-2-hydroxyacid dehydrogenase [Neptuniibacter caesariensis]EAR59886.1 glycerate dehydrogenase [Oceanospirillum sp. MED92] [Neptuniibacter caesariensis]
MRAVILDLNGLEAYDLSPLRSQLDELVTYDLTPKECVGDRIQGFDIVITNKTPLSADLLSQADRLKYISVLATGTNVVDKQAASELSIPVSNCVAYGVDSVVQHVWSMILALHTNLVNYSNDVRQGEWQKAQQFCFFNHPISELKGKTLGIVGYGNLGQGVAKIAEAFGMQVLIANRPDDAELKAGRVLFDTVVENSDVISLHCPLTEGTRNLFIEETFRKMKGSAMLINAARGGIVNEEDLASALRNHEIAAAATDVLSVEPPANGNPLLGADIPNLLVTPHIAWGSEQARQRIIDQTAENIAAFLQGKIIRQV